MSSSEQGLSRMGEASSGSLRPWFFSCSPPQSMHSTELRMSSSKQGRSRMGVASSGSLCQGFFMLTLPQSLRQRELIPSPGEADSVPRGLGPKLVPDEIKILAMLRHVTPSLGSPFWHPCNSILDM